jgi:hypothetical protein
LRYTSSCFSVFMKDSQAALAEVVNYTPW